MMVFITHPKYFDKRAIARKSVDLVYIFNSKKLFDELSKKYKCVNIDRDGKIINENFFPQARKYKKLTRERFLDIKIGVLKYFKKKRFHFYKRHFQVVSYNDPLFKLNVTMAKKRNDFNEAVMIINGMILEYLREIFELEKGRKFVEEYFSYIEKLLNYSHSFYRSYVYANEFDRGIEVFADVFMYNFFSKVALYYTFEKKDIYKSGFHFNYLKVLSRLFIEDIHKADVIGFVNRQVEYYKENEWF